MTILNCRICDNVLNNKSFEAREMMFASRDVFDYFECSNCGCLNISEMPENLGKYYQNGYYSYTADNEAFSIKRCLKEYFKRTRAEFAVFNKGLFGRALFYIKPDMGLRAFSRINVNRKMSILDVGCGSGFQLKVLKDIGFENVLGVDPFIAKDIEYSNLRFPLQKSQIF